jgi:predicted enzyme related to lactoylglutathione lyase
MLINIDVPNLERAIRFYEAAVGLTLHRRLFADTVAEMHGAPIPIYLLQQAEGTAPFPGAHAGRSYEGHWTPVHLDFVVNNIETAIADARKAGATLETELQSYTWGRLANLRDPFGNGFCFLQWSGSGYTEII